MSYLAKKLFHNDNATHKKKTKCFIVKLRPPKRPKVNGIFWQVKRKI